MNHQPLRADLIIIRNGPRLLCFQVAFSFSFLFLLRVAAAAERVMGHLPQEK
jgi:hypothetical protein